MRAPGAGQVVPAPEDPNLVWVGFMEAEVPEKTRDGRSWHETGSLLPDPYAVLLVNGQELLRTAPQTGTIHPTWPESPKGNFRFQPSDRFRVELWEAGIINRPICIQELGTPRERWLNDRQIEVSCGSGRILLRWEPAHGRLGYGFAYEMRTNELAVTRVLQASTATKAGILSDDRILTLQNRKIAAMTYGEIQSYLNAPRPDGILLHVQHANGSKQTIRLKEGPVYPLFSEYGVMP